MVPYRSYSYPEDGSEKLSETKLQPADTPVITIPGTEVEQKELDENYKSELKRYESVTAKAEFKKYKFQTFYHPYLTEMMKQLNRYGIEGLLDPKPDTDEGSILSRQQGIKTSFDFESLYDPADDLVDAAYPKEQFDFDVDSPYGIYNWELFFHGPLLIASKLTQNQRFDEARTWLHYIFNPTEVEDPLDENGNPIPAPARFWKIKPFFDYQKQKSTDGVADVLAQLSNGDLAFNQQLDQWMKNPFQPHVIARLRIVAYMKTVVMKYLDNLIVWGDSLFRQDTIESINEATQLYILASQILGPKPVEITKPTVDSPTVQEMMSKSTLSDHLAAVESELGTIETGVTVDLDRSLNAFNSLLYFCTSPNDKLLQYWDTVADRLFKIRHCMNIEGVTRSLALFEPPIDPALLVKAAAAGLNLGEVISGQQSASLPNYKFRSLVQKAIELCGDVKNLGQSLLSALEKKDAEELALLRSNQEVTLLKATRQIKERAIEEAKENLSALENAKELAEIRYQYYSTREFMNSSEQKQLKKIQKAFDYSLAAQVLGITATIAAGSPIATAGIAGSFGTPFINLSSGGATAANVLSAAGTVLNRLSDMENMQASKAGIKGGYERRRDDWELQAELAQKEIEQVGKQIIASEIRLSLAERDLTNHDMQIEQSNEVADFMQNKYTNRDLYNWMITQISNIYFQSYKLAFDVAQMAQRAFRHELAQTDATFIQFGHWNSLRKGLLSGDKLQADLRRMEVAYIEQNRREYELTKHISLGQLSPFQLMELKEKGVCEFQIPEVLFDLDHPGQYLRRIKAVRITIPCVTGPYTTVNAKLTIESNRIRKNANLKDGQYPYEQNESDDRFSYDVGGLQSVAISSGQNDSGVFELNFNDERYLPFEGAGAISKWRLELAEEFRQFDYNTISDVIIHMNYTAREGGNRLKAAANENIKTSLNMLVSDLIAEQATLQRAISLKTHFPNALYQLLRPGSEANKQSTNLVLKQEHFPYFLRGKSLELTQNAFLFVRRKPYSESNDLSDLVFAINEGGLPTVTSSITEDDRKPLPYQVFDGDDLNPIGSWKIDATSDSTSNSISSILNQSEIDDVILFLNYTIK